MKIYKNLISEQDDGREDVALIVTPTSELVASEKLFGGKLRTLSRKALASLSVALAMISAASPAWCAEHTKKEKDAVSDFLETHQMLFASPCNTDFGANDIANKLEVKLTNDLDPRFMEYGLTVVEIMRALGAGKAGNAVTQNVINGTIDYFSGSAPKIDLGEAFKDDVEFKKKIGSITTSLIALRLLAEKEFGYNTNLVTHYNWTWKDGALSDDYSITNKNTNAWKNVTISFARYYVGSGKWNNALGSKKLTYTFDNVAPGETLRFVNLFMSSEEIDGGIFSILITNSNGNLLKTWKCQSKREFFTALLNGHSYYFECLTDGKYYPGAGKNFYTHNGTIPSVVTDFR